MKALRLNAVLFVFALTLFTACGGEQKQNNEQTQTTEQSGENQETAALYTCPMHPEVKSDQPGKCPKCGMNLEKVAAAGQDDHEGHSH